MKLLRNNKGLLSVEASMVMPIFVLSIMAIALIMKIVYTHNLVQHALTESAKEISTYSYLYSISGAQKLHNDAKAFMDKKEDNAEDHIDKVVSGKENAAKRVNSIIDTVQVLNINPTVSAEGKTDGGELTESIEKIRDNVKGIKEDAEGFGGIFKDIKDYPGGTSAGIKNEFVSMACLMANGAFEEQLKPWLAGRLAKYFMNKHLATEELDSNQRLLGLGVVEFDGNLLDFSESTLFSDNKTIDLVVSYNIKPMILSRIFPKLRIVQRATVLAWLDGDGKRPNVGVEPEPTEPAGSDYKWPESPTKRGNEIQAKYGKNVDGTPKYATVFDKDKNVLTDVLSIDLTSIYCREEKYLNDKVMDTIDGVAALGGKLAMKDGKEQDLDVLKPKRKVIVIVPQETTNERIKGIFEELKTYGKGKNVEVVLEEYGVKS